MKSDPKKSMDVQIHMYKLKVTLHFDRKTKNPTFVIFCI